MAYHRSQHPPGEGTSAAASKNDRVRRTATRAPVIEKSNPESGEDEYDDEDGAYEGDDGQHDDDRSV